MIDTENLLATPIPCVSAAGYPFDINDRQWKLARDITLNLSWTDDKIDEPLRTNFIELCRYYAEKYSASHTQNLVYRMKEFVRFCCKNNDAPFSEISTHQLISYRATLTSGDEYHLGNLKGYLKEWARLGIPGVSKDVKGLLDEWRFKGNPQGVAVQTRDPRTGPLTDVELQALFNALVTAYGEKRINLRDYALMRLAIATGRRPAQLCDLKIKDLVLVTADNDQDSQYLLNIPRRKQRGVAWREEMKMFAITQELGSILTELSGENVREFQSITGLIHPVQESELALFPNVKSYSSLNSEEIVMQLTTEAFHLSTENFGRIFKRIAGSLEVYSERTGGPLHLFPTRLRRTKGTRSAAEGYGVLAIAEILDHSDINNAHIYVENRPDSINQIDSAIALQLAPFAQAFSGQLINGRSQAKRADEPESVIRDKDHAVGNCGHYGFCGALAPIACYTCKQFQPWLDAPHQEVLKKLEDDKKRILKETGDETIASVNDRTMLAVAQVIHLCEARTKKEARVLKHG